jgi:hypothetical protein
MSRGEGNDLESFVKMVARLRRQEGTAIRTGSFATIEESAHTTATYSKPTYSVWMFPWPGQAIINSTNGHGSVVGAFHWSG